MSDTPCACGCGQDAATIERLREQLAKVEALADEWEERCEHYRGTGNFRAQRSATDELRAALTPQNHPRSAADAPEAPGHGEGAGNAADGRVEALARALPLPGCGCDAHYSLGESRLCRERRERDRRRQAERILADPGPLLAALAEADVLQRDEDALIHYRHGVNSGTLRARNTPESITAAVRQHEQATHGPIGVERVETRATFAHTTEWAPDARP